MQDLTSLLEASGSGWTLMTANGISDSGYIVCMGVKGDYVGGNSHEPLSRSRAFDHSHICYRGALLRPPKAII